MEKKVKKMLDKQLKESQVGSEKEGVAKITYLH